MAPVFCLCLHMTFFLMRLLCLGPTFLLSKDTLAVSGWDFALSLLSSKIKKSIQIQDPSLWSYSPPKSSVTPLNSVTHLQRLIPKKGPVHRYQGLEPELFFNVCMFFLNFFKELELFLGGLALPTTHQQVQLLSLPNGLCLLVGEETKVTIHRTMSVSNMRADSNGSALCPFCQRLYPPPSPILDLSPPQKASPLV